MKVLWLCNVLLPELSALTNTRPLFIGGWMSGLFRGISSLDATFSFVFVCPNVLCGKYEKESITLYTFNPANKRNEVVFENILKNEKPDIIHIHGTEFRHSLEMVNAAKKSNYLNVTVLSLQGIVGFYARHYYSNLKARDVYGFSARDFLKLDNVYFSKKAFERRGRIESKTIKNGLFYIGRTNWDKACLKALNRNAVYYHANEILRDSFYEGDCWNINNCERFSIFVTQSNYPIKGFHILLEAVAEVKKYYPSVKIYTTGKDFLNVTFINRIKESHYTKTLRRIIKNNNLAGNIVFMGGLNEKEVKQKLLKTHVFVLPSSIENSPNSLGEAMILGVPCVVSYVGGVPDMIESNEGFLYQYDASYMLAYYIMLLFENEKLCVSFSERARRHALETHNIQKNSLKVMSIYREIIEKSVKKGNG